MHAHHSCGLIVRALSVDDLAAVAAVHLAAFPDTVVSRLGRDAARRQYHSLMTGAHETTGLGAFEGNRLIGFCFVGVRHASERVFVMKHAPYLAWRLLSRPWLWVDPVIRRRLVLAVRMCWSRPPQLVAVTEEPIGDPLHPNPSVGVQYIAVDPRHQCRGVGRTLLAAGETHAKRKGLDSIHLSVEIENVAAITLYLRMGWEKSSPSGEWRGLMTKRLTDVNF